MHDDRKAGLHSRTVREEQGRLVDDPAQRALLIGDRVLILKPHPLDFEAVPQSLPLSDLLTRGGADDEGGRILRHQIIEAC